MVDRSFIKKKSVQNGRAACVAARSWSGEAARPPAWALHYDDNEYAVWRGGEGRRRRAGELNNKNAVKVYKELWPKGI